MVEKLSQTPKKKVLITGASSGIGREFANQLAYQGCNLIITARRTERLEEIAINLNAKYGIEVNILPADLSVQEGIDQVINTINRTPDFDMLVNCAGFGIGRRFLRADPARESALLHLQIIATTLLCRAALPAMVAKNKGTIINVSSLAGIIPIRSVVYGSCKSYIVVFSEGLQDEVRDSGIKIQALCPGFVITEFHDTLEFSHFNRKSIPDFLWMPVEKVVAESLKSLNSTKVVCIPGTIYSVVGALGRNSFTSGIMKGIARSILRRR